MHIANANARSYSASYDNLSNQVSQSATIALQIEEHCKVHAFLKNEHL